jgi:hypothetical protein
MTSEMTKPLYSISVIDYPLIRIDYMDDAVISLEECHKLTNEVYARYGQMKIGVIHVAGTSTTIDENVREYIAERSRNGEKFAEAFVIKNLNQRILANFYLRIFKPGCPTEIFSTEIDAIRWMKSYLPNGIVHSLN